jgi:hypothetical protein
MSPDDVREKEYRTAQQVNALRRLVFTPDGRRDLLEPLVRAERELRALTRARQKLEATAGSDKEMRGERTTGLVATVELGLTEIPTAVYQFLDPAEHPLVSIGIRNTGDDVKRVRVVAHLEGYSARAVDTVEIDPRDDETIHLQPALFADRIRDLTERTTATLNVSVEDLDGRVELNKTFPVGLLARTTVPLGVTDERTRGWTDLSPYLGAFVTPNAAGIMALLSEVARRHPDGRLSGYQDDEDDVTAQVKAVFDTLHDHDLRYVNSVLCSGYRDGTTAQRVRLPRQSLADGQANCIDATVLMASLLEAMSLNPALVVLPAHALLAWEAWDGDGEWRYLETTALDRTFEEARARGEEEVAAYLGSQDEDVDEDFRRWPLSGLRAHHRIFPME